MDHLPELINEIRLLMACLPSPNASEGELKAWWRAFTERVVSRFDSSHLTSEMLTRFRRVQQGSGEVEMDEEEEWGGFQEEQSVRGLVEVSPSCIFRIRD